MSEKKRRILIVGGVAGGASAAARARRLSEDDEIVLIERGEHVSFANCGLPYHIGGVIENRDRLLVMTPERLWAWLRIEARTRCEAIGIDRVAHTLTVRDLETGESTAEPYDALVLSPGARPIVPPLPGVDSPRVHTLRSLGDMDAIKRRIDEEGPERALVVGGGFIGLEMAEAFRERGVAVTLVERGDQVLGPMDREMAAPLHEEMVANGVDLRLETSVEAFEETDGGLVGRLSSGERVACGLAVMAIGVRPESDLAREAGLDIGAQGGIVVDAHMRTSDPSIYAVGDAVEVEDFVTGERVVIPLAGPANRQGRIAADNIAGIESQYKKSQGTAICKVFGLDAAATGANEKNLARLGIAHEKVYVHPLGHAGYYPGAAPISLKLLFDPGDGRVLGAQAVGRGGVDKRIDVLAVAIRAGLTVFDLEELELAYAPPYGSAKDPVNYAGFVAANALRGHAGICHAKDVLEADADQVVVDVRTRAEFEAGSIAGAVNVPLEEIRDRLGELPKDKELLVHCQVGLRGYLACRILAQKGFRCRNLSGGYKTFRAVAGDTPRPASRAPDEPGGARETHSMREEPDVMSEEKPNKPTSADRTVDARGLQCPGPIMQLRGAMDELPAGGTLLVRATDPGFAADAAAWCRSTGNELVETTTEGGECRAVIRKSSAAEVRGAGSGAPATGKTLVVFSNDLDRVMAAFIIANGAAAMGGEVTLFFTFWGLNVLRKDQAPRVRKSVVERMFGWMMPRGAGKLSLSKMHMGGVGTAMMKGMMKKKNVNSLAELMDSARQAGVRFVACSMSMDLMGIRREELIDGVEEGGVAVFLDRAAESNVNLFI